MEALVQSRLPSGREHLCVHLVYPSRSSRRRRRRRRRSRRRRRRRRSK